MQRLHLKRNSHVLSKHELRARQDCNLHHISHSPPMRTIFVHAGDNSPLLVCVTRERDLFSRAISIMLDHYDLGRPISVGVHTVEITRATCSKDKRSTRYSSPDQNFSSTKLTMISDELDKKNNKL